MDAQHSALASLTWDPVSRSERRSSMARVPTGLGFKLRGRFGQARSGSEVTDLRYIGPATDAAIWFYGANELSLEDINVTPGLARNGVVCTTANQYNTTLSAPVTAGTNVIATVATVTSLQVGAWLGIDAGGVNFEIVRVKAIAGSTFTADFAKNHASGVQVGGGSAASGWRFNRCRLICPESTIWTTLSVNAAIVSGVTYTFTPVSMAGIEVGTPLRIGSYSVSETAYVTAVTATTFTADVGQSHLAGDLVMYPTAAILFGNRITQTVQISEAHFNNVSLTGAVLDRCYAGIRQISGGNTKNFIMHDMLYQTLHIPFCFENSSGAYVVSSAIGAAVYDTIFLFATAQAIITGVEDESRAYWVRVNVGNNPSNVSFIGCTFQGGAPQLNDEVVIFSGQLSFVGCLLRNGSEVFGTRLPVIVMLNINTPARPCGLALINCYIAFATATSGFVRSGIGGAGIDVIADGTSPLTMLNCKGGESPTFPSLPTILPPTSRWQNTATYDPPSLAAAAFDTVQTMTVTGAALGDLVETSFSLNLQGAQLRAWVSAANTVSYQFSNPTAGVLDLASGTVKVRVKK